jgi:hypothetical protein
MVGPPTKRQKRAEVPDGKLPQKKFFRQRAHANPFSDHNLTYPESPAAFDWAELYPAYTVKEDKEDADASSTQEKSVGKISKQVEVADIGCGFGGLLFALAPIMPDKLLLGTTIDQLYSDRSHELIDKNRHGDPLRSNRIRPDKGKGITFAAYRNPGLPERCLLARQHDEILTQLLHQGTTQQDLPMLPRSAFQSSQTQG